MFRPCLILTRPRHFPLRAGDSRAFCLAWNQAGGYMTPDMIQHPGYGQALTYDGDAPLISCSITGGGKGRGRAHPNMLTYPGQLLALDIKGEIFRLQAAVAAKWGTRA